MMHNSCISATQTYIIAAMPPKKYGCRQPHKHAPSQLFVLYKKLQAIQHKPLLCVQRLAEITSDINYAVVLQLSQQSSFWTRL